MKPDFSFKLTKRVENYIKENEMIGHGDSVIIGLSGGADSVCLFLLLNALKNKFDFKLYAVHVNHGIRGESADRDEQFSKKLCIAYNVPFMSYHVDVPKIAKEKGLTEEEAGRNERYDIFRKFAQEIEEQKAVNSDKETGNVRIAVAHHMDDQAETVLFNMVRGSGLKGIGGMSPVSSRKTLGDNIRIIRPLLCITKEEILEYLNSKKQEYCIDETNSNNDYSRNQIRNVIIPALNEIQPRTSEHISYMSDDARAALEYVEVEVEKLYNEAVTVNSEKDNYNICVKSVKELGSYIIKELIIFVLKQMIETYKDITKKHIEDVYGLFSIGKGKYVMLPYNLIAKREKDSIVIYKSLEE